MLEDLIPKGETPDPMVWVILAAGVIALIFCVWVYASI